MISSSQKAIFLSSRIFHLRRPIASSSIRCHQEKPERPTNEAPHEQPANSTNESTTVDKADFDKLVEENKLLDGKYKRVLADMQNLRARLDRELDDSKRFAIRKFSYDLIEITDVMRIAFQQITPESVGQQNYDGIKMIDQRIRSIFSRHGLASTNPLGAKFDPYEHQAVYENPDPHKEPGTICEVCKEGWKLNDKVIRPAVVGVVKKPD